MTGKHSVRRFTFLADKEYTLPEGWKPFAAWGAGGYIVIVCRKWHRAPKTDPN